MINKYPYNLHSVIYKSCKTTFLQALILSALITFVSCENDIEKIHAISDDKELADQSGKNVEVTYSDSGKVKLKFITPELYRYPEASEPNYEFPKGIKVFFYDDQNQLESTITANYAIYYIEKKLWKAQNNVVAKNFEKNKRLDTEELYWDEESKKIYSDKFSKIVNEDGIYYGENGFEANQDLSKWKLIGSKGTVTVDEQENQ